jgi:chemotaxis protein CheX
MNDQDIQVFISTARRYFASLEERPSLVIEPPFVREKLGPFLEYTGIIGVSGRYRGVVCFTATGKMLGEILGLLKETRTDEAAKKDLVGEIANTLSGNAREELGSEFRISVPTVAVGSETSLGQRNGSRNYAIPLNWHSETAYLLVALE